MSYGASSTLPSATCFSVVWAALICARPSTRSSSGRASSSCRSWMPTPSHGSTGACDPAFLLPPDTGHLAVKSPITLKTPSMSEMAWLQYLPAHDKLWVAVERSRLSDYRHRAGTRARRNPRFDICIRLHRKLRLNPVEGDSRRSSQAVAEDEHALPDWANHRYGFHQRAQVV